MAGLWQTAPETFQALQLAEAAVREQCAKGQAEWEKCLARPRGERRQFWMEEVHEAMRDQLLAQLDERERLGQGLGRFGGLLSNGEPKLADAHFRAAVQRRLQKCTQGGAGTCRHKCKEEGARLCGQPLGARGRHPRTCKVGGAILRRHDCIRDWLGT